jgi:hypothetical protein
MIGGRPPKLSGQVVAHVADGKTLIRVEEQLGTSNRPAFEKPFPTELLPLECREFGSRVLVTWNPDTAVRLPNISN